MVFILFRNYVSNHESRGTWNAMKRVGEHGKLEKAQKIMGKYEKHGKARKSMGNHGKAWKIIPILIKILKIGASAPLDGSLAGVLRKIKTN